VSEVQCYVVGGAASRVGDEIRVYWNGPAGLVIKPAGWASAPYMHLVHGRKSPLMYLPFRYIGGAADTVSGMGSAFTAAMVLHDTGLIRTEDIYSEVIWHEAVLGTDDRRYQDSVVQPVDWLYKADSVTDGKGTRLKARGVTMTLKTHGRGYTGDFPHPYWPWGGINYAVSVDGRDWVAQPLDHTRTHPPIKNTTTDAAVALPMGTVAARLLDATLPIPELETARYSDAGVTYGDVGVPATGTYIIKDEEVLEVSTSDNMRGTSFSYMVFGFLQSKGQAFTLESLKAAFRPMGYRRRRRSHE